jgi:hypothetical protein
MYGIASQDWDNKPALRQKSSKGTNTSTQTKTKHHNLITVLFHHRQQNQNGNRMSGKEEGEIIVKALLTL